jgi:two-component system, sensor histidine kinase
MSVETLTRPLLVLIIEDNVDTAEGLARFLRIGCGYAVVTATDGLKGLQAARNDPPDVIICDLGLPKRNGLLVGEEIAAAQNPRPLLMAVTGYGDAPTRDLARNAGFDHFLVKPADPFVIEALIEAHFASRADQSVENDSRE